MVKTAHLNLPLKIPKSILQLKNPKVESVTSYALNDMQKKKKKA